jgi:predicted metal-binding membrane protein
MVSEESPQLAAHIAQELRDAGLSCGILNLVPTEPAVLRRDRILVGLALISLIALAWSYVLRLSVGMDMGGTDMAGFRIIPSSTGLIMVPAHAPWGVMEFAMVFVMSTVMMVGMMTPSAAPMILMYARLGRQTEPQGAPLAATV